MRRLVADHHDFVCFLEVPSAKDAVFSILSEHSASE